VEFFDDESNKGLLKRLLGVLDIEFFSKSSPQPSPEGEGVEQEGGGLFGKKVCITGSFEGYKRDDLVKILEESGGEFMSSVTQKTDFLLA
jgi:NAD-dependent DNA ligase